MSEPRRSTRARAREEAAPVPETPKEKETHTKGAKSTLKRKRGSIAIKDPAPSTPGNDTVPQTPKQTLPLRLIDGEPLPTLPEPQPLDLSTSEWQDIQQSGVLGASLERSRAVWVSGVNFRVFHKHFTQPKKPSDRTEEDKAKQQRQKDLFKNFPELGRDINNTKDTIEIQAQLVVEPHTFPIRLYAPREVIKHAQKKPAPTYGHWPNHSQPQHNHPNQYTQYNTLSQPQYPQRPPAPKPPPPKPVHKPQSTPSAASAPAPDPVIHALAQRAGTDPELKSVMKIVAAGQASKAQLEFFQNHINELTAMLAKSKDASKTSVPPSTPGQNPALSTPKSNPPPAASKSTPQPPMPKVSSQSTAPSVAASTATPKPATPAPVQSRAPSSASAPTQSTATPSASAPAQIPSATPSSISKSTPQPAVTPSPVPPPIPRPVQPAQMQQNAQYAPKPYSPAPPQGYMPQQPPMRPPQAPYPNQYGHPQQQYNPSRQMYHAPPPPVGYRPLVFSFEEGNKDLLHFPSYSFMEWLPNMSGAKFSFLVTKLKPKPEADGPVKQLSTPAPNTTLSQTSIAAPNMTPGQPPTNPPQSNPIPGTPGHVILAPGTPVTPTPYVPPPRIEDFDEKNDVPEVDFYQPVTVLLLTDNNDIRQALLRAIRPPDVVEKYMDEVFDKCKRAEETYLAFRLPKDGDAEVLEKRVRSGDGTPVIATSTQDTGFAGFGAITHSVDKKKAGRPRKSLV